MSCDIQLTGRKADMIDTIIGYLDYYVTQNSFFEFDKKILLIQQAISKCNRSNYQFPSSARLSLVYREPFSYCEIVNNYPNGEKPSSLLAGTPMESMYHEAVALSPAFIDKIESQQTTLHFSINSLSAIRLACGKRNASFPRILILARPLKQLDDNTLSITDKLFFPFSCRISVNSLYFRKDHHDKPLDITSYCAEHVKTQIIISYCNLSSSANGGRFVFQVIAAWEVTSTEFIERLLTTTGQFSHEETLSLLSSKKSDDSSSDEVCMPLLASFSLICPLSLTRMRYPGRTIDCKHVQCFDVSMMCQTILSSHPLFPNDDTALMNMISSGLKQKQFMCPVCGISVSITGLKIDSFFKELIKSHPSHIDSISIQRNNETNTWSITPNVSSGQCLSSPMSSSYINEIVDLTLSPDLDYSNFIEEIFVKKENSSPMNLNAEQGKKTAPSTMSTISPVMPQITPLPTISTSYVNISIPNPSPVLPTSAPFIVESESDDSDGDNFGDRPDYYNGQFNLFPGLQDEYTESDSDENNNSEDDFNSPYPSLDQQFESQILSEMVNWIDSHKTASTHKNKSNRLRSIRLRHCSFDLDDDSNPNTKRKRSLSMNVNNVSFGPIKYACNPGIGFSSANNFLSKIPSALNLNEVPSSGFSYEDPLVID